MDANVTPTREIPWDLVRIAVREHLPPVLEATKTLEETMKAIRTKLDKIDDAVDTPPDDADNQGMTDTLNGLLKDTVEVNKQFKDWHGKLNLACVLIGLVYPQQEITSGTR
jgi:hypothetical protein